MKTVFSILALALLSAPAFADASKVTITQPKNMSGNSVIEISGPAADELFDNLSEDLMDSSDAENDLGRPVWKSGKNIYCIKYVMGKIKTATNCSITITKKGEALSN